MNENLKTLIEDLLGACNKAIDSRQVHPAEILGAISQVQHVMHRQFTDNMFKPAEEVNTPANVAKLPPSPGQS